MSRSMGDCPVCNKTLEPGDDIVICPSCGAPYHRACYQKQGRCSFAHKHAAGFEYRPPRAEQAPPAGEAAGEKTGGTLCPACGTVNEAANIFCENCGTPLHAAARGAGSATGASFFGGPVPGYAAAVDLKGDIDGIPKQDWATFIGQSAPTYLMRLAQMQRRGRKSSFMFSAFFFTPAYFAYRKMWGWAALSMLSTLLFAGLQMVWLSADAGMPLLPISLETLNIVSLVGSYLSIFVRLMFAVYALEIYRKNAGKRIQDIRHQAASEPDAQSALARQGGVSIPGVVLVYLLLVAFNLLFYWLMGDAFFSLFAQLV